METLHSCSDPFDLDTEDVNCLSKLADNYRFISVLGSGVEGVAIKVSRDQRFFAVKIAKAVENRNSLKMACRLNDLKDYTGIFVYTYGWLTCNTIPNDWSKFMEYDGENKTLLFTVMELSSLTWPDVILTKEELVICFLVLLHGFHIAYKKLGFVHNDLHPGNILLQTIPSKDSEVYLSVDTDLVFKITGEQTRFVPKIIDFGLAVHKMPYSGDLTDIKDLFQREANLFEGISNNLLDLSNFEHPMFEKYRTDSRKRTKTCFTCSSVAKFQRGELTFCSKACSDSF